MPTPARLVCATVPLFPLAARLRSEPELAQEAVVVLEGNGSQARVVAANRRARRQGVSPGTTLAQARSLCSQLVGRERDPECERAAQEALLETAETFSPRLEDGGEGLVFLDLDGLDRLDRHHGEMELGEKLMRDLAAVALPARVGIASSKLAARVAADLPQSPTRVPPGEEASFLAPLPLERLAPEMGIAATLARWGVHSIGDLARLPGARLASRFGALGHALHAAARGFDPEPLKPREPPPDFQEGMSLEWPIVNLEPFLFVGRAALERLSQRLEARGLACSRLLLTLRCEPEAPEGCQERAVRLPAPTRDVKTLLALIRLELEARPPGAPVAAFRFTALPDRPREAQLSLYGPPALSPDKLATAMARLFSILGSGRAGSPLPVDGHHPERFGLVDFTPPPAPAAHTVHTVHTGGRGLLAVRVLRPPVALEVILNDVQAPVEVLAQVSETARRLRIDGRVQVAAGPWALEEEWWQETPVERDYWDVELASPGGSGGLYRIYRDRATEEWYADGVYD